MISENASRIAVRDAEEADVPALTTIKGDGTEVLHRDRLRDAQGTGFRYLVLLVNQEIIGFAWRLLCVRAAFRQVGRAQMVDLLAGHWPCIPGPVYCYQRGVCPAGGLGELCRALPAHYSQHRLGLANPVRHLSAESSRELATRRE